MKRVQLIFFDAGGGHRSAATALEIVIRQQQRPWDVQLVNLQEALDSLDPVRKLTGVRMQDSYNLMLKKNWTLGSPQMLRVMHSFIRVYRLAVERLLERHWDASQPDLVVSLVPHFNRPLYSSLQRVLPGSPYVTVLTDLADYPPHFWIERQTQFFICGTERAVQQARALGHGPERIFRASGMILHPRFYEQSQLERSAERERLGLRPGLPTGLVLFGGQGSRVMLEIVERLDRARLNVQLILLCGRNEALVSELRRRRTRIRIVVEGFTPQIPYYMRLADFFIGKPGPGSISEALAMRLPVIVECNAWTLPQERYNTEYIREKQVGLVLPSFRKIAPTVAQFLCSENLDRFRENATRLENRAVFEIPEMLEQILEGCGSAARREPACRQSPELDPASSADCT
jgi:Glycosyltransferase family 28 C-terminal domain/Monogalactosyldiacylglycerol (MGDG) synthase